MQRRVLEGLSVVATESKKKSRKKRIVREIDGGKIVEVEVVDAEEKKKALNGVHSRETQILVRGGQVLAYEEKCHKGGGT